MADQDDDLTIEARIVSNAEDFIREMERAMDSVSKAGKKAATDIQEGFAKVKPERGFLETGRQIIKMAEQMGISVEKAVDAIKEQNTGLERTTEELLRAARAAKEFEENIKQIGLSQIAEQNIAGTMLQNAGITPELLGQETYETQLAALAEKVKLLGEESETYGELRGKVEALNEATEYEATVARLAADVVKDVAQSYEAMGQEMPIKESESFAAAIDKTIEQLTKEQASAEEVAAAMENLRQKYTNVAATKQQAARQQEAQMAGGKGFGELLGGGVTKLLTGAAAGFGIAALYQKANAMLKESIGLSNQAEDSLAKLTIAVREHQRSIRELSPTVAEAVHWSEELSDKFRMTQNEAQELISQTLLLTKDLRLSSDETKKLAEQAAVLGQVYGRDATTTLRTLTEALNSGRTEGLDTYGISVDSTILKVEAVKRGFMSAGDELDAFTKRQVIAAIIEERANSLLEDSNALMQTRTARLEESAEAAQEAKEEFGALVAEADLLKQITLDSALVAGLKTINILILQLAKGFLQGVAAATTFGTTLGKFAAESGKGGFAGFIESLKKLASPEGTRELQENLAAAMDVVDEEYNKRVSAILSPESLGDIGDLGSVVTKTVQDAFDTVGVITEDSIKQLEQRTAELWKEYQETISEIQAEFSKRRAELEKDHRQEVADEEAASQRRKVEAQVEFNRQEKREAEDHNIEMRRLEEDYLIELDDLVRERDAKGVLMAQRRYNVEKRRREEDYSLGSKRRQDDFQYELKQLEYQRALRLQMLQRDYQERQAALAQQEAEALKRAQETYTRQLELERKAAEESLKTILEAAKERLNLSAQELKALYDMLVQALPAFKDLWGKIYGAGTAPKGSGWSGMPGVPSATGHQRGGTFFAVGPTAARFGEGGPERVDVTPMSASTGEARPGFGGGGRGDRVQIELDVKADPMLVVEIGEQTMSDVADVVVRMTRADNGGLR